MDRIELVAEATQQYLQRYAESEVTVSTAITGRYDFGLVVPARDESPDFVDGYWAACRDVATRGQRVLLVIVVNARFVGNEQERNCRLIASLRARGTAVQLDERCELVSCFEADLLMVNRNEKGAFFSKKEGAGHARKIGADILFALFFQKKLTSPWLCSTDADTALPVDYFSAIERLAERRASGLLIPFQHCAGGDAAVDRATWLHELWLRYYVSGLRAAGSPYAFHALGSALAVHAEAYAQVRGFSKRLAGEDYYTLDKLAKLRPLQQLSMSPVRIRARRSNRVPFGTGPQVAKLTTPGALPDALRFYDPRVFEGLKSCLGSLHHFSKHRQVARLRAELAAKPHGDAISGVFEELGGLTRLELLRTQAKADVQLEARIYGWFDGLRTLQFIHRLRDCALPSIDWKQALEQAPFFSASAPLELNSALELMQAEPLPSWVGVARVISGNQGQSAL